jgi:hypothetical protein
MNNNRFMRRGKYESSRTRSIRSAFGAGRAAFLNEQARRRQEAEKEKDCNAQPLAYSRTQDQDFQAMPEK